MRISLTTALNVSVLSICATVWLPFAITIGGLNLRASQVLLPGIVFLLLLRRPETRVSLWSLLTVLGGLVWWSSLVVWTIVNGPQFGHPMARVALMGLNLVQAMAAYVLIVRIGDVRRVAYALLASVTLLNGVLLAVSMASTLGVPIPTTWLAPEVAPVLVNGQVVSATVQRFIGGGVLVGCVSAATAAMAAILWFDPNWGSRWLLAISGAASVMGMVLGFSRQALLSLAVGLLIGLIFLARGGIRRVATLVALVAAFLAVGVSVLLLTPAGRPFWLAFAGRAAQFADSNSYVTGTAAGRTAIWSGMAAEIAQNPFVGQGQDSYLRFMGLNEEGAHDFAIEAWHATGILGWLGYLLLHGVAPLLALVMLTRRRLPEHRLVPLVAMLSAYLSIVAASLTNLIYWNPTYWLVLAAMVAAVRLTDGSERLRSSAT